MNLVSREYFPSENCLTVTALNGLVELRRAHRNGAQIFIRTKTLRMQTALQIALLKRANMQTCKCTNKLILAN